MTHTNPDRHWSSRRTPETAKAMTAVPIFSAGRTGPTHVILSPEVGGIPHDGVLFCEELTTIIEDFLADGLAGRPVPDPLLQQVVRAIRRAIGDVILEPDL